MAIKRKHSALTYRIEKKILDLIAPFFARYFTADHLSLLALAGAIMASVSYALSSKDIFHLNLASFGIFLHWMGDSLDGRVARLRNESRPKYGHYLDHMLDAVSVVIIIFGLSFSGMTMQSSWIWVLVLFLLIMIHSFLKSSITSVFELSFERIGPTEARIGLIFVNYSILLTKNPVIMQKPIPFNLLDLIGFVISAILLFVLIVSVIRALWGKNKIKEN